jgi:large subunit ribosomal protein L15
MDLSNISPPKGQVKKQRRIGRGMGSGRGKTSGRGQKGQKSISGYSHMRGFEGGQMPMHRRLPKRGFSNALFQKDHAVINVSTLIKKLGDGLKVLGNGELTRKIDVTAHLFSKSAEEKIKAAGGTVTVIPPKVTVLAKK